MARTKSTVSLDGRIREAERKPRKNMILQSPNSN